MMRGALSGVSTTRPGLFSFPRPVWLLGWVSLATDSASEAIYPLLPFFLTQILGAGAVSLGIVEGAAEAANSVLKILSGRAADRARARRPLVLAGYSVSSLVRPLIAVARSWPHVFAVRVIDRVGKGIRSAPRDAMLATWTTAATRGKVYGFHRAMDHAGAVLGPALASVFLFFHPGEYRTLFALTIVPGAIAVILIFFVREGDDATDVVSGFPPAPNASAGLADQPSLKLRRSAEAFAKAEAPSGREGGSRPSSDLGLPSSEPLPRQLHAFFIVLTLFTLGNSTDAFLLLKLTNVAGSAVYIPLMWAGLHVVKATVSVVGGSWSDRIGRRAVIACGWIVYALVYIGFAVADSLVPLLACFFTYGLYFGFSEGTEKALVADLAPVSRRGMAFGLYNAVLGAGGLVASVLFGVLWSAFGPAVAFGAGAALSVAATVLLLVLVAR
jgi:MFS family permease